MFYFFVFIAWILSIYLSYDFIVKLKPKQSWVRIKGKKIYLDRTCLITITVFMSTYYTILLLEKFIL
jgi:hypothetical protein